MQLKCCQNWQTVNTQQQLPWTQSRTVKLQGLLPAGKDQGRSTAVVIVTKYLQLFAQLPLWHWATANALTFESSRCNRWHSAAAMWQCGTVTQCPWASSATKLHFMCNWNWDREREWEWEWVWLWPWKLGLAAVRESWLVSNSFWLLKRQKGS